MFIYVDSLRLFAAGSLTGVVGCSSAGSMLDCIAAFSGIESRQVNFFSILNFFVFCTQILVLFRNVFTYSEKT